MRPWPCFPVTVSGRRALDAGASTGGFTDCLLQRGAARTCTRSTWATASSTPRSAPMHRVTVLERTNARTLTIAELRAADPAFEPCPLVVTDLSFISLRSVIPALTGPVSAPDADLVLLVKPQFEAGRAAVSRGKGVVRDPSLWLGALEGVVSALHDAGTGIMGAMASPLTGAAGNVEFLLHARKGVPGSRCGRGRRPDLRRRVGGGRATCPRPTRPADPPRRWRPSPSWSIRTAPTRWRSPPRPPPGSPSAGTRRGSWASAGPTGSARRASTWTSGAVDLAGTTVAVSMGGDGTFLRVVRLAATADVPVLGVNFGRLGYLPDLSPEQVREALTKVLDGTAAIEERCALEVSISDRSIR